MTQIARALLNSLDHRVFMSLDWDGFETFLELRGDSNANRITYLDGCLEIMSPSNNHEFIKKHVARLLECWAEENDVDLEGYGSFTVKKKSAKAGAEADECYVIGVQDTPPTKPELAIEVNWSTRGVDKLEAWRRLGVAEVWVWEDETLRLFRLNRKNAYTEVKKSKLLPSLDLVEFARFARMQGQAKAVKAYRAALQKRQMR